MKLTVIRQGTQQALPFSDGETLLSVLQRNGCAVPAHCGGNGTCGKCRVQLENAAGSREVLSCRCHPCDGDTVRLTSEARLEVLGTSEVSDAFRPDMDGAGYGIACDIGTTTVACRLVRLSDGAILGTCGAGNDQRAYGADVISRISAAESGALPQLQAAITGQLGSMICQLCRDAGISPDMLTAITAAGNPTMCHLLTGLNPAGIGRAPYTPVSYFGTALDAEAIGLPVRGKLYILPSVSGYVGGDITADLLAVGADRQEQPILLIDVGTNGEMVLGSRERMLCCSTAAGPAFEGAEITCGMTAAAGAISSVELRDGRLELRVIGNTEATGICGSGLIDAVAVMLDLGALEDTGRLPDPEEDADEIPPAAKPYLFLTEDGEPAFRLTDRVYVTQADIRRLQLGKGAIAAGWQVLCRTWGAAFPDIGALLLSGGFGSLIRPESAARIGMIPAELLPVTHAAGNTALEGACGALISRQARERLSAIKARMEYLELSGNPLFSEYYIDAMMFPCAD